jgi:hypothetical protein
VLLWKRLREQDTKELRKEKGGLDKNGSKINKKTVY